MKNYSTINVQGRVHVLCDAKSRSNTHFPDANYLGTGKALCGVLERGESLEEWNGRFKK